MKRTQRRKGLHRPPPASTLSSPLYERILQFKALSSFRQQGTDVRMFAQKFSDAAEGLGLPKRMQLPQWWLTKLQCLQWQLSKLQHPQLWSSDLQRPQWRPKKRHPVFGNGGGGRKLLPPFKAWRPFQSPLPARRPSLSRPSSSPCRRRPSSSPCRRRPSSSPCRRRPSASPCRRRPSASPCRRRPCASPCRCPPGFSSCWGRPGCLPSSWLRPGLLLGRSLPGPSRRLHPGYLPGILFGRILPGSSRHGHLPGFLFGRILHGPSLRLRPGSSRILNGLSLQLRPGSLPGSLDCVSLPGSTLPSLPGHAELPCWH